jgi:hypothetical protein
MKAPTDGDVHAEGIEARGAKATFLSGIGESASELRACEPCLQPNSLSLNALQCSIPGRYFAEDVSQSVGQN